MFDIIELNIAIEFIYDIDFFATPSLLKVMEIYDFKLKTKEL